MRSPWMVVTSVCGAWWMAAGMAGAVGRSWTDAEMEEFLRRATIEHAETLSVGVTGSQRGTLSLDGRTHDAHIQTVDEIRHKTRVGNRIALGFRDSYRYNIAAYRLDRLLGLNMVPVSVERTVGGRPAAVTWWIDDVLMMERERLARGLEPPDPRSWYEQVHRRRVFDQLISNVDLNQTNILITRDWQVRLVDFTRAFRRDHKLADPDSLVKIERSLLDRLRGLSRQEIERELGDCLTAAELRSLLARRDALVERFEGEIERRGVAAVVYEAPGRGAPGSLGGVQLVEPTATFLLTNDSTAPSSS